MSLSSRGYTISEARSLVAFLLNINNFARRIFTQKLFQSCRKHLNSSCRSRALFDTFTRALLIAENIRVSRYKNHADDK